MDYLGFVGFSRVPKLNPFEATITVDTNKLQVGCVNHIWVLRVIVENMTNCYMKDLQNFNHLEKTQTIREDSGFREDLIRNKISSQSRVRIESSHIQTPVFPVFLSAKSQGTWDVPGQRWHP